MCSPVSTAKPSRVPDVAIACAPMIGYTHCAGGFPRMRFPPSSSTPPVFYCLVHSTPERAVVPRGCTGGRKPSTASGTPLSCSVGSLGFLSSASCIVRHGYCRDRREPIARIGRSGIILDSASTRLVECSL
jgi:hypothetical protein